MNTNQKIQEIFSKYILSAHARLDSKRDPLGLRLDNNAMTYFEKPRHPEQLAFQVMDLQKETDLLEQLRTIWKDEEDLLPMSAPLAELAAELRKETVEQAVELSNFIYVMY